jgi:AcrR family transcriptional regulator
MRSRPGPRERLIAAVQTVMNENGYSAGIEEILTRADVARRSLYQHFGGKDELIAAALRDAARRDEQRYRDALDVGGSDPRSRIQAMFAEARCFAEQPGYRGCRYTAAYMSLPEGHPAHQVAREHKRTVHALLRAELAGTPHIDPDTAATQLVMLLDAVDVAAVLRPGDGAETAVLPLLDAILTPSEQSESRSRSNP